MQLFSRGLQDSRGSYRISVGGIGKTKEVDRMEIKQQTLTIKQAAALLDVHIDTVRSRIKRGEIFARMVKSPYGMQWEIPAAQFNVPMTTIEAVQVTKHVTVADLQGVLNEAVKEQTHQLREEIQMLQQQVNSQEQLLREQNEMLKAMAEERSSQQQMSKRGFFSRFFG